MIWGTADPGVIVTASFAGLKLRAKTDSTGVWRQRLPAQDATPVGRSLEFAASDGGSAQLADVVFGDVFLCGGQSNMEYTPRACPSGVCMNNMSAEIAAADGAEGGCARQGDQRQAFAVNGDGLEKLMRSGQRSHVRGRRHSPR